MASRSGRQGLDLAGRSLACEARRGILLVHTSTRTAYHDSLEAVGQGRGGRPAGGIFVSNTVRIVNRCLVRCASPMRT